MMWRVVVKYKYNDLYFDFASLDHAGAFSKVILKNYKGDDDGRTDIKVMIEPVKEEES